MKIKEAIEYPRTEEAYGLSLLSYCNRIHAFLKVSMQIYRYIGAKPSFVKLKILE